MTSPITFEANHGQAPRAYPYIFHRNGLWAMFLRNGVDLALPGPEGRGGGLQLRFLDANSKPEAQDRLGGHSDYFLGDNPSKWIRNVPLYGQIEYMDLYRGISLKFFGNGKELEHDFRVAPGADPSQIAFRFGGALRVEKSADGNLKIRTENGALTFRKPVAYQDEGGRRQPVNAGFQLSKDGTVRFRLGKYDRSRPLVIDPVIVFSTYLGGTGSDNATSVTTDASGNILVTGSTTSTDFPTANPLQPTLGSGGQSVFITKFDPTGKTLIYSTYLGGSGKDSGPAITVDSAGNAIIGGVSTSIDFPHAGAISSPSCPTNQDCYFMASLSPDGSTLNYSGLIGGPEGNWAIQDGVNGRVTVDQSGNAYLAGDTYAADFQVTAGTLATSASGNSYDEGFVLKVDPTGKLIYSTVLPGNAPSSTTQPYTNLFLSEGIAVDASGDVTVAGLGGVGLPTTSGVVAAAFPNDVSVSSASAGFVLQLNPTASAIQYASYLPGTDMAEALAVGASGNLYFAGQTAETTLPVSGNAYQKAPSVGSLGGIQSGYILELNPTATSVVAATYLDGPGGANQSEEFSSFTSIALDSNSNVYVGGMTGSADFPMVNPLLTEFETPADLIVAEMSPDLSTVEFGSFVSARDITFSSSVFAGLTVDDANNLILAGTTYSLDFPTTAGSFEPQLPMPLSTLTSPPHTFVVKIDTATPAPALCYSTQHIKFGKVGANISSSQSVNVINCGNAPLTISSITSSDPTVTVSQNCGQIASGSSCAVMLTFTPVSNKGTDGIMTVNSNATTMQPTLPFSGEGLAPVITASPNPFFVGHLEVGTPAMTASLEVLNNGQESLIVSNVAVSGAGFSLANNGCTVAVMPYNSCVLTLSFAPQSTGPQNGSLVISSNDPVTPVLTVPLTGAGDSAYAVPTISSIGAGTVLINNGPLKLQISGTNFYPESVVKVAGVAESSTFVSNSTLLTTVPASSLTQIGELPLTVVNPTPGGGTSASVPITPYETLLIHPAFVVSVPANGMLYAAIPANASTNPNTVIPINPATGEMGTPIPVGNDPGLLAASSDGSYLYVANQGSDTLQRINLATNEVDRTFPYTPNIYCSTCSVPGAADLAVVPGNPTEVLLSQASWLSLFNDSGLVNYVPNNWPCCHSDPDFGSIALAGNPLTVYGLPFSYGADYFQIANLTSSGLAYTRPSGATTAPSDTTGAQVISDGTLLYTSAGQVWDPSTQTQVGTFPVQIYNVTSYPNEYMLTLDSSVGEIYTIGDQDYGTSSIVPILSAYGMKSYAVTGTLAFPQIQDPHLMNLVRWGKDGLAFIAAGAGKSDQELYILRSSVVSPQFVNPTPVVNSISPSSAAASSPGFTLTVNGGGFLSNSVVDWNGSQLATSYVSAQQLTATVPASLVANAGTAQVAVLNPAPGGGSSAPVMFPVTGTATTTNLTASATQITQGTQVTLTAKITSTSGTLVPSGTVTFFSGPTALQTATLANGTASITTTALPAGTDAVSASLSDAGVYAPSSSNTVSITVVPAPAIASLSPAFTSAGGAAFTLTVSGAHFVAGSTVYWGSTALTTQYAGSNELTAQVTQAPIASAGVYAISVQTPSPGGGTSNTFQFEVEPSGAGTPPSFSTTSVTVSPGSTATYPVTLASSATNVSVKCLNLPSGAACSYSSSNGAVKITTSSSTPAGTYAITVVFTETLPGAATAFIVLPILLLPFAGLIRKWNRRQVTLIVCAMVILAISTAAVGCGGGGGGSSGSTAPPPATHQVTTSATVNLIVK